MCVFFFSFFFVVFFSGSTKGLYLEKLVSVSVRDSVVDAGPWASLAPTTSHLDPGQKQHSHSFAPRQPQEAARPEQAEQREPPGLWLQGARAELAVLHSPPLLIPPGAEGPSSALWREGGEWSPRPGHKPCATLACLTTDKSANHLCFPLPI